MRSPVCLSVRLSVPLVTFKPTGNFHEIRQVGHAIEGDLDTIIFHLIASTILKWWGFISLRRM
jgi:hypothetical protein